MNRALGKLWAGLKFLGRWLGPVLVLLALYLFLFPLGPFLDLAGLPALAGGIIAAIAWLAGRKSQQASVRRILASAAVVGLAYWGYSHWSARPNFRTETVSFANRGARIVGTLYLPGQPGKHPGFVWVHGGGPGTRQQMAFFVTHFARNGYAILVPDKRGIGDSTGTYQPATILPDNLDLLASDASTALDLLAARPEVRADKVGFVGTSAGGWVTAKAAVLNSKTMFIMLISGATYSTHSHIRWENYHIFGGKDPGGPESQTSISAGIKSFTRGDAPPGLSMDQAVAEAQKLKVNPPFADYDPVTDLRKLTIPGLWIDGDADWTIPSGPTRQNIAMLRAEGKPFEYRLMPGGWHSLMIGPRKLSLDTMDEWLARATGEKR